MKLLLLGLTLQPMVDIKTVKLLDIELDAMRRDFTINSIYMKISGEIVDP